MNYSIRFYILIACFISVAHAAPLEQTTDIVPAHFVYSWEQNAATREYFGSANAACQSHGAASSGEQGGHTVTYANGTANSTGCTYHYTRIHNATGITVDDIPSWTAQSWFSSWAKCPEGYLYESATASCKITRASAENSCPPGNPIYAGKGNKSQYDVDYSGSTLSFSRQFASWHPGGNYSNGLGTNWFIKTYHRHLEFITENGIDYVYAIRKLGEKHLFTQSGSTYAAATGINNNLTFDVVDNLYKYADKKQLTHELYSSDGKLQAIEKMSGQTLTLYYSDANTPASTASIEGLLIKVEDDFGRNLRFTYNANHQLVGMLDANGGAYQYEYTGDQPSKIIYPDGFFKLYHYKPAPNSTINQSLVNGYAIVQNVSYSESLNEYQGEVGVSEGLSMERVASPLAGITDENGVRFSTYDYDAQGRAIATELAGGVNQYQFVFNEAESRTTITNGLNKTTEILWQKVNNTLVARQQNGNATPLCEATSARTIYDWKGYSKYKIDANNNWAYFYRNTRGLAIHEYQGYGTPESRHIHTYWHADYPLPTKILYPDLQVEYTYDSQMRVIQQDETDRATSEVRSTQYTYDQYGHILSLNGPRDDVSDTWLYAYNALGDLITTTNPLGHTTHITAHDTDGRPLTQTDTNGINTQFTYNPRGKLTHISTAGRTTVFGYNAISLLTSTTLPSGMQYQYEYDDAHRLIAIEDADGNRIEYTLDVMGNRLATNIKNSADQLVQTATQIFDALSRLHATEGANGQETTLAYDKNNNAVSAINPLNNTSTQSFDALNRLIETVDPDSGVTHFSYDSADRVTTVTDAENKTTSYTYNAFGDLISQASPDTGTTTFTYDKAGNRLTKTDARNATATYAYDALNRITAQSYTNTVENIAYTYDDTSNNNKGIGRLTGITDQSGATAYQYNGFGQITQEASTINGTPYTTNYQYNTNGQLTGITYPNGRTVNYSFNTLDQINGLSTTHQTQTTALASNITYLPFGPLESLTFGNGKILSQSYDQDYRLTGNSVTGLNQMSYVYDLTNNITDITGAIDNNNTQSFTYDNLSRLLTANGEYGNIDFTYDKVGNRQSKTENAHVDTYSYATSSHQLESITGANAKAFTHDAVGNTLTKGDLTFTYNEQGRMDSASKTGMSATYTYNAKGQRSQKQVNGIATHFVYDLGGQLIAEANGSGVIQKEYIYFNNQRLASIDSGSLYYVHTDHLGTPIALTDTTGVVMWKAHYTPFGKAIVDVNNVTQNLRFVGQYADGETNLHYNYFRDYDPEIGRYLQSDPIGILRDYSDPQLQIAIQMGIITPDGLYGSLNHSYGYAEQNPVNLIDPTGLVSLRAALMQAIARGNTRQIRNLMDALSDPKLRKAAQDALDKFGSKADDWIGKNCKGSINREFPENLRSKTLEEIRRGNSKEFKKAWKLLNDKRFQK